MAFPKLLTMSWCLRQRERPRRRESRERNGHRFFGDGGASEF